MCCQWESSLVDLMISMVKHLRLISQKSSLPPLGHHLKKRQKERWKGEASCDFTWVMDLKRMPNALPSRETDGNKLHCKLCTQMPHLKTRRLKKKLFQKHRTIFLGTLIFPKVTFQGRSKLHVAAQKGDIQQVALQREMSR